MPTYNLRGIDVDFPFEAYDCQLVYMEKVIESLQNKTNALLESPTGTGKTLCLLCATLSWRKSLGAFSKGRGEKSNGSQEDSFRGTQSRGLPTIVYTSRTHSQIRQVIQELKRTNYRPKMVVLGSREQFCIHEDVSLLHGKAQNNACQALRKKKNKKHCSHFARVTEYLDANPSLGEEPIDIEDLVNIGRSCGPCPYYLSRELHRNVDILFAPYNYLIDRGYRKTLKIRWDNSVLIFDEAHNLESLCADAASFDLPASLLNACIAEAKKCIDISVARRDTSNDKSSKPEDFATLKALLMKLEKRIGEVPIKSKELGFTKPGPYIYELLSDLNITSATAAALINTVDQAILLLEEDANSTEDGGKQKAEGAFCRLETMAEILRLVFKDDNSHAKYYRAHVQEVERKSFDTLQDKTSRILSWWCFNPGIAMEEFSKLGVGSIILTSGTLSPLDSFADELKLEFPIRLENPHVIADNQIWAGVVPTGPSAYALNSSFRSRDSQEYKQELGNAIVNFARIVPDGLLVFFPSYYMLDQCIGCWKTMGQASSTNSSVWERICKHKLPVVEPRQSSLFPTSIEDYMTKLKDKSTRGAVFFAVCRGKVSEGLDFADHAGRAVVVTGLPFATWNDPKVRLKREYLDEIAWSKPGRKVLTGEEWYGQQASRAVNQAVGRVIRHRHDYGAIIFCDERFSHPNRQAEISLWIKPYIKRYSKFGEVVFNLTRFFRDVGNFGPTKLELAQNKDQGICNTLEIAELLKTNFSEKFIASETTEVSYSAPSVSSVKKRSQDFYNLPEIVPANRSSYKISSLAQDMALKHHTLAGSLGKNEAVSRSKKAKSCSSEIINLSDDVSDGEPVKLTAPCFLKKRTCVITGPDETQNPVKSHGASPASFENRCKQNDESCDRLLLGNMKPHNRSMTEQKNKATEATPATCDDKEKVGSEFLVQVKEKLTNAEYKEFVNLMKALKSKAMKIGLVLESITRLFSQPGRLLLLQRFKGYIPAKYHTLYEQCIESSQNNNAGVGRDASASSP